MLSAERLGEVVEHLQGAIAKGARAYWVCPLVEESEKIDLAAAEERAAMLRRAFGAKVGLVHGRMKGPERDAAMAAFKAGETQVLVATTVIEVGVDVPEATIMVVEHAERFGLAQLHQLRGRVGRGAAKSTCLLIYHGPLGETAKARLKTLRETDDGFVIAEEDLQLRGAGEMLGTRQSGLPEFRMADLAVHGELLAAARDDAKLILARDPELQTPTRRGLARAALSVRARRGRALSADGLEFRAQAEADHAAFVDIDRIDAPHAGAVIDAHNRIPMPLVMRDRDGELDADIVEEFLHAETGAVLMIRDLRRVDRIGRPGIDPEACIVPWKAIEAHTQAERNGRVGVRRRYIR